MSEPGAEPRSSEPVAPRLRLGWVVFWLLLGSWIGGGLYTYLARDSDPERKIEQISREIETELRSYELSKRLLSQAGSTTPPPAALSSLDPLVSRLADERAADPEAAFLYTVIRVEQGYAPDPEDLERLRLSEDRQLRAVAALYAYRGVSESVAHDLADELPDAPFAFRLAKAQGLERAGVADSRDGLMPTDAIKSLERSAMLVGFFCFACPLLLVAYLLFKLRGSLPSAGFPVGAIDDDAAESLALRTTQMIALYFGVGVVSGMVGRQALSTAEGGALFGSLGVVAVVILSRFPVLGFDWSLSKLGLNLKNFKINLIWGVGAAIVELPASLMMGYLGSRLLQGLPTPEHPLSPELAKAKSPWEVLLFFFILVVIAPVFEEICFRGAMLPAMARLMKSPAIGILATSLLFAAIHPTGIPAWLALATTGAFAAITVHQTGSLVPAIVLHGFHNGMVYLMSSGLG